MHECVRKQLHVLGCIGVTMYLLLAKILLPIFRWAGGTIGGEVLDKASTTEVGWMPGYLPSCNVLSLEPPNL